MQIRSVATLVAVAVLASACATRPPSDLDLGRAGVAADPAAPGVTLGGSSGKLSGAGKGAAAGGGLGFLASGILCAAAGPLFGPCVATVMPASTAVGVIGGGALGAAKAESSDAVDAKLALLRSTLAEEAYPRVLAQHVRTQARELLAVDLPLVDAGAGEPDAAVGGPRSGVPTWLIEVALVGIFSPSNGPGQPYAVQAEARVRVRRAGEPRVAYESIRQVKSDAALTTEQWAADDARVLRAELDQCMRRLAVAMVTDLARR